MALGPSRQFQKRRPEFESRSGFAVTFHPLHSQVSKAVTQKGCRSARQFVKAAEEALDSLCVQDQRMAMIEISSGLFRILAYGAETAVPLLEAEISYVVEPKQRKDEVLFGLIPSIVKRADVSGWLFLCPLILKDEVLTLLSKSGCLRDDFRSAVDQKQLPEVLGTGGFGQVTRGIWKTGSGGGTPVAIKRYHNSVSQKLMRKEVDMLTVAQGQSSVIGLLGFFKDNDGPKPSWNLVMDLHDEGDLAAYTLHYGGLNDLQARKISFDLFSALRHLGNRLICHADVRPENVLVTKAHRGVLCDFGNAMRGSEAMDGRRSGTVGYAAPEQLLGETLDLTADAFAAGATLYFAIAKEQPFLRDSEETTVAATIECQPDLARPRLQQTSHNNRNLLRSLLCPRDKRLTAADCLLHPALVCPLIGAAASAGPSQSNARRTFSAELLRFSEIFKQRAELKTLRSIKRHAGYDSDCGSYLTGSEHGQSFQSSSSYSYTASDGQLSVTCSETATESFTESGSDTGQNFFRSHKWVAGRFMKSIPEASSRSVTGSHLQSSLNKQGTGSSDCSSRQSRGASDDLPAGFAELTPQRTMDRSRTMDSVPETPEVAVLPKGQEDRPPRRAQFVTRSLGVLPLFPTASSGRSSTSEAGRVPSNRSVSKPGGAKKSADEQALESEGMLSVSSLRRARRAHQSRTVDSVPVVMESRTRPVHYGGKTRKHDEVPFLSRGQTLEDPSVLRPKGVLLPPSLEEALLQASTRAAMLEVDGFARKRTWGELPPYEQRLKQKRLAANASSLDDSNSKPIAQSHTVAAVLTTQSSSSIPVASEVDSAVLRGSPTDQLPTVVELPRRASSVGALRMRANPVLPSPAARIVKAKARKDRSVSLGELGPLQQKLVLEMHADETREAIFIRNLSSFHAKMRKNPSTPAEFHQDEDKGHRDNLRPKTTGSLPAWGRRSKHRTAGDVAAEEADTEDVEAQTTRYESKPRAGRVPAHDSPAHDSEDSSEVSEQALSLSVSDCDGASEVQP